MSKVIITGKEIDIFKKEYPNFKNFISKYKEEDYKEVYINKNGNFYYYDIYRDGWFFYNYFTSTFLKEGFYTYSILEKVILTLKNLDKDKIYIYKDAFLVYNRELEVWEEIFIKCNKYYKLIKTISLELYNTANLETISKEEFNKLILTCELVS